jgi:hypothetical protein
MTGPVVLGQPSPPFVAPQEPVGNRVVGQETATDAVAGRRLAAHQAERIGREDLLLLVVGD